jgi:dTDP-4-dehydrorhamnose 3,5-epimerase
VAERFQALTESAEVSYRIEREHPPSEDVTIAHHDPKLGGMWRYR